MQVWKLIFELLDEGGRSYDEIADEVRRRIPGAVTTAKSVASTAVTYKRRRRQAVRADAAARQIHETAPYLASSAPSKAPDLRDIEPLVRQAREVALRYKALTGRPLGVTGEVGEFEAARLLRLELAPARAPGYDAVDHLGRRFQIKTRCMADPKRSQRIGALHTKHPWEMALLVLLDESLIPLSIWEADRTAVVAALDKPGSIARNERRALSVSAFMSIGRCVWKMEN